ncbi:MAG: sugar phosphate isomerase/epimerase family protein [Egibacteraceae bacterium]
MTAERVCGIGDEAAPGLADQLRVHRDLGLSGIELRTIDGRGLHELSDGQAHAVAEAVIGAGLAVPVVDTPIGGWATTVASDFAAERALLRRAAGRAALLGCHRLRVMSYPNDGRPEPDWRAEALRRMRTLTGLAADLGVTLLHENCQGWAGRGASATRELLEEVASPHLRLVFDVGNGLAYGYDAAPFLREVLPFVDHVHVKDGVRAADGTVLFGLPGDGEAGLAECLRLLDAADYRGWYSLEPHVAHVAHLNVSDCPERLEAGYRACVIRFLGLLANARAEAEVGGA